MDLLLYALGGALIAALVRWWRPEVSWQSAAAFLLLAGAFFAVPLATPAVQGATDIAYRMRPWSETVPEKVRPLNPLLSDIPLFVLPMRSLVRERLLSLEAPLWAHELGTGQPLLGSAQAAPFAPLHLLALPLPPVRALTVAVAWQVLLGLLLTYALVLGLGGGRPGAALAAVGFAFSTYAVAWAYHPLAMVAAFLPGVVLALVLLRRGERGGPAGLVVCAFGMTTAGHPETVAHTALACAVLTGALLLARQGSQWISRGCFLARLGAAAALTFCLSAPALLPVLEALPESERALALQENPAGVQPPPFKPRFLLLLADPLLLGSPRDGNWKGPQNFNELCTHYAGLVTLGLALAGAVLLRGKVALILAGGLAALLAGMRVPPLFELVQAVPGLEHGAHARLRLFWVLAVAVAAGLSLDGLLRLPPEGRRRTVAAVALAVAGTVLASAPPPGGHPWERAWWIAALAGLAAVLLSFLLVRKTWAPWIAVGAVALDLLLLGCRYHPVLPARYGLAAPPVLQPLIAEAKTGEPFRVVAEGADLSPNLASLYGLWDPRGNDPMRPARPAELIGRRYGRAYRLGGAVWLDGRRDAQALHDYLGVRYQLTRHRRRLPPPWQPAWDDAGGRVWRNPGALPLFFFPAQVRERADPGQVFWWTLLNRDFAALAWVEAREEGNARGKAGQTGTVRLRAVRANGFDLETDSAAGGIAVSSVSHARGWQVEVDGRPGVARRVNAAFLGFEVPPGRHRVRLDYRPLGWTAGLWLAGAGLLAVLLAPLATRALASRSSPRSRDCEGSHEAWTFPDISVTGPISASQDWLRSTSIGRRSSAR